MLNMAEITELTPEDIFEENYFYRFGNIIDITTNIVKRINKDQSIGNFTFNFDFNMMKKTVKSSLISLGKQTIDELMVVMGTILKPESDIFYKNFIDSIRNCNPSQELEDVLNNFDKIFSKIKNTDIKITLNEKERTADEHYLFVLKKILEADDTEAMRAEKWLSEKIYGNLIMFEAHSYALNMYHVLHQLILTLKASNLFYPEKPRKNQCIFCLRKNTNFSSKEHTFPQSLGNTLSILPRGWSCDDCNKNFSLIEEKVSEMMPFTFLKVFLGVFTKKGRFQSSKFSNIHISKNRPNLITVKSFVGEGGFPQNVRKKNGGVVFNTPEVAKKTDYRLVARILIKAALGAIAIEKGRSYVLGEYFNDARNFALNNILFEGSLILQPGSKKIQSAINIKFLPGDEMVSFNYFGVEIGVSIISKYIEDPPIILKDNFKILDYLSGCNMFRE